MEIDKKICIICKKQIEDGKEYICTDCYNKSVEKLEGNELYQELKNKDDDFIIAFAIISNLFKPKGE